MTRMYNPPHPGEVLRDVHLSPQHSDKDIFDCFSQEPTQHCSVSMGT